MKEYPEFIWMPGKPETKRTLKQDNAAHQPGNYGVRSPGQIKALEQLALELISPSMIGVEVGCHTGVSTEIWAKSCKKIYAIDIWPDDWEPSYEEIFDFRMKEYENVIKMKGSSDDFPNQFEDESLDFIYIDGGHIYERVMKDFKNWARKVKPSGLIMGHDYIIREDTEWPDVVRAVKDFFGEPDLVYEDNSFVIRKESDYLNWTSPREYWEGAD